MVKVESWVILNFFTSFLLILLLIFQSNTSRLQKGRKYSAILVCTLILLASESIGRIGEVHGGELLILARIGYYLIFLLDPVDILFAINYIDCWMDDENLKRRGFYRNAFAIFAVLNGFMVTVSSLFELRWFFYFEEDVYYRGEFFLIRAITLMVFIILLLFYAIRFRNNFVSEYKNAVLFLPIFALIGAILQVFLYNIDTTYGGISLGCLILFFSFQSKDVNADYLTGVLNRRGLDIKMQEKVKQSISTGKNFSAIMMDIDNFKDINDQFGHEAGDKAIKSMADILVDIFGEDVAIGRFGGDEFCVIIDSVENPENLKKIEKIHDEIARLRKKNGWSDNVDVSCGYRVYEYDSGMTAEEFQKQIDELMYDEKQQHHANDI
ncbi:MAG: diguanylate cyclase [Pseudobutyrivibrio sp.]|nr:diguanylate cyclase [Pseudobutyrivibrio sp.]